MTYEHQNGITLGATDTFLPQHMISQDEKLPLGRLATVLEWKSENYNSTNGKRGSMMTANVVRGNPYVDMKYINATPRLRAGRSLSGPIVVDNNPDKTLICGKGDINGTNFSKTPVLVTKELLIPFDGSDMTWLVFVSEPTYFECSHTDPTYSNGPSIPGVPIENNESFELRALGPMKIGMVRAAMGNNCTTGQNPECESYVLSYVPSTFF
jgi:hypothetical protein